MASQVASTNDAEAPVPGVHTLLELLPFTFKKLIARKKASYSLSFPT